MTTRASRAAYSLARYYRLRDDPAFQLARREQRRRSREKVGEAGRERQRELQRASRRRRGVLSVEEYRAEQAIQKRSRLQCDGCGGVKATAATIRCRSCFNAALARVVAEREAAKVTVEKPAPRTPVEKAAAEKVWRETHPGYMRSWKARNREKVRAARRARGRYRRARVVEALLVAQRGRCAYCRVKLRGDFHVDHIVPRARGGSNRRSNLQLACADCNISKSAKDPIAFAQSIGMLI